MSEKKVWPHSTVLYEFLFRRSTDISVDPIRTTSAQSELHRPLAYTFPSSNRLKRLISGSILVKEGRNRSDKIYMRI